MTVAKAIPAITISFFFCVVEVASVILKKPITSVMVMWHYHLFCFKDYDCYYDDDGGDDDDDGVAAGNRVSSFVYFGLREGLGAWEGLCVSFFCEIKLACRGSSRGPWWV